MNRFGYGLLFALTGCGADMAMQGDAESTLEEDMAAALLLDVNVIPPLGAEDKEGTPVLRQSSLTPLTLQGTTQEFDVPLRRSVTFSGQIQGYEVSPWLSPAELPGQLTPVDATLTLRRPNTQETYTVRTNPTRTGFFSVDLVQADDYELVVVPDNGNLPPSIQSLGADTLTSGNASIALGTGVPIYGFIVDHLGQAMPGISVHAEDPTGIVTSAVYTDDDGEYVLRVPEGEWRILAKGAVPGRDPELTSVFDEVSSPGARVDLRFGEATKVPVSGRLVNPSGNTVPDALVRFTADSLDAYPEGGASLEVETESTSAGTWDTQLVPGSYLMEVIPARGDQLGPYTQMVTVGRAGTDLGSTTLPAFVVVTGLIIDQSSGAPVSNAGLQCTETGITGYSWSTYANESGQVLVALPEEPVSCVLTPPGDQVESLATTLTYLDPGQEGDFLLEMQKGTLLQGQVTLDGVGVPFAAVEFMEIDGNILRGLTTTDSEGFYALRITPTFGSP